MKRSSSWSNAPGGTAREGYDEYVRGGVCATHFSVTEPLRGWLRVVAPYSSLAFLIKSPIM